MASAVEDFFPGTDVDELISLLDGDILEEETFGIESIEACVHEESVSRSIQCVHCNKLYKTASGLARHVSAKHQPQQENDENEKAAKKLHPLDLKKIVLDCAKKLNGDLCYSQDIRDLFGSDACTDALDLWKKLKGPILKFNGDSEKFHANLFGLLIENLLPEKFADHVVTNTLMIEVVVGMANHFNNKNNNTPIPDDNNNNIDSLSERELSSLEYLAGYVVKKLLTKFRYGRLRQSEIACTYATLLQSFKVTDETQKLIDAKDRGGLWKINRRVIAVFLECELLFRKEIFPTATLFNKPLFVQEFLRKSTSISKFHTACSESEVETKKEIRMNLLDHMVSLYVNVRMFSHAKDIRENHKIAKKTSRKRSLRTEMKKSAADNDDK